jgi:hypothetical protein
LVPLHLVVGSQCVVRQNMLSCRLSLRCLRLHCLLPCRRASSKKQQGGQYLDEMVAGLRVREVLEAQLLAQHPKDAQQYRTAYMRAAETSEPQLCSTYLALDLDVVAGGAAAGGGSLNPQRVQRSLEYRAHDQLEQLNGTLGLLPHRLREFLLGDVRGLGYGREYQQALAHEGLPQLPPVSSVVRVHNSAVVAADVPWNAEHFELQTVRALPDFHTKPFYDCVEVRMVGGALQYAQLLLLFGARLPDASGRLDVSRWQSLAYVRWFAPAPRVPFLSRYGVLALRWDKVPYDHATQQAGVRCSVIPLSSIRRRVHVMPAFEAGTAAVVPDAFFVNPFVNYT